MATTVKPAPQHTRLVRLSRCLCGCKDSYHIIERSTGKNFGMVQRCEPRRWRSGVWDDEHGGSSLRWHAGAWVSRRHAIDAVVRVATGSSY